MKRLRLSRSVRRRKVERLVKQNPYGDYDHDGVPNISDCQPLNPKRHGIEPNQVTWDRLKKLPIFIQRSGAPIASKLHISDSRLKEYAPVERTRFLSIIKHYPEIIGEIEHHSHLEQIIFSGDIFLTNRQKALGIAPSKVKTFMIGGTGGVDYDPKGSIIGVSLRGRPLKRKPENVWRVKTRKREAEAVFHELRHAGQVVTHGAHKTEMMAHKGIYRQRPMEKQAFAYGEMKISKRDASAPSERVIASRFRQMFG